MGRRVHGWTIGGVVAIAIASLAVGAAPALASGTVSYIRQFGAIGGGAGDLNVAGGMAVDNATGDVYVADNDNDRIDEFDSSGAFLKAWGAGVADGTSTTYQTCTTACRQGVASGSAGGLNRPQDVAIDATGILFVADAENERVDEFDTSGNFEKAWGWGVADGQQRFETCTTTCQSGTSNVGTGALSTPFGVAVTPSGDVVVAEYGNSRVSEFDPSQSPVAFVRAWGSGGAGASQFDGLTGIGVDPASGDVYAVDSLNYRVQQFTSAGGFIRAWGWGVADGVSQFETCGDTGAGCQSGIFGSGTGQFASPIRVASGVVIDPSGAVDVIDVDGNRVQQFSKGGGFVNMFGWGVADGQNQFENCTGGCQGGKGGTGAGEIWGPSGIATDSAGHLYVDNGGWIEVYSSTVASVTHRLTAATAGAGSGTVTSDAAGIDCGNACSAPFDNGSQVTLTANPASGSKFTGWSGGGCSGTGTCTVTLNQDATVTATFAASGCDDTFTGSSGGDWGTAANWSAGVPGSSTVACWSGKIVAVSAETATAASIQGGDLSIGTNGSLTLASSTGSSSVGALSISGGSLDGPSGATLSVDGNFTWSGGTSNVNGNSGAALAISQTAGHSLTIGGTGQQLFYGGSIQTDSPVSVSDPHFAGANGPSLTTTSTVTFAPGTYDANGNASTKISAGGMVTSGDTALPNFALHLTGGTTSIPSGRTVSAGSIAVDGGTLEGDGTISGSLTNTGGTVAPGSTLVVTGGYTQQSGGTLAIAVNNTTAGSGYSVLSVGGNVTLDGTLDLNPSSGYAASAQTGDTIGLLTYSGSRTGQFATTMVNPALDGGRSFTAGYRTAHQVDAVVGASTGQHTLTVSKAGSGSGTVTSSPAGIDCGSTCSAQFDDGTQVTLTVAPDTGSTFTGWSGGGCSGTQTTCTVKMGANVSVTASFARIWTLSVVKAGAGSGSAGIDCSGARSCSVDAVDGTKLTLTAAADAGSTFAGWSGGGCSGTQANCIVTLHSDQTVTATFATAPRSTTTGLVSSANPATVGQQVTYTATVSPAPGGGTVQFTDGGTAITGCGAVAVNLSDGTSSCQTSYGAAGQHSIQAIYSGTSAFGGSQSGALTESVSGTSGAAGGCNTLPARDAAVPSGGSQAHYEIVLEGVDLGAVQSVSGLGQLNSAPAQYGQPGGGAQSANQHTPVLIEAAQCSPADIGLAQWAQTWVAHGGTAFENVTIGVFDNAGNVVQSYAMTKANLTSVVPCQLNAGQNQICVNAYTFVFATFSAGTSTWPGQTSGAATVSNGAAVVTMNCASSKPCGGLLTLTAIVAGPAAAKGHHTIVLGKTRFRVRPHHQAKLSIRLSRAALRLLKRTHTLRAQLSIDPTGVPKSLSARRTIKLVKR